MQDFRWRFHRNNFQFFFWTNGRDVTSSRNSPENTSGFLLKSPHWERASGPFELGISLSYSDCHALENTRTPSPRRPPSPIPSRNDRGKSAPLSTLLPGPSTRSSTHSHARPGQSSPSSTPTTRESLGARHRRVRGAVQRIPRHY